MKTRKIALKIFDQGIEKDFLPKDVWKLTDALDERDRDLARKLVYGTLRFRRSLDETIDLFLKKPNNTPKVVRNLLRFGAYEILFLRVPEYATVNEYTEMAPRRFKGLVNAILRSLARNKEKVDINHSLPLWLYKTLKDDLGRDMDLFLEKSLSHELSIRAVKIKRKELKMKLSKVVMLKEMRYSPWGLICSQGQNLKNEAFKNGDFTFQDESSQLVAIALDPKKHENILDACGGVGTKTSHFIQISPISNVFYNDINNEKRDVALSNFKRLGLSPTELWNLDLLKDDVSYLNSKFDKVLLDAPCSALGTVGKHPDVLLRIKPGDIKKKSDVQLEMLERLWNALKQGGTLIYSVCTVTKAETDNVISNFIKNHENAKCVDPFDGRYEFDFNGLGVQLLKYMEGFYISKIVKV